MSPQDSRVINVGTNWYALAMLKENIKVSKDRNQDGRFNEDIAKNTDLFKTIMKESIQ